MAQKENRRVDRAKEDLSALLYAWKGGETSWQLFHQQSVSGSDVITGWISCRASDNDSLVQHLATGHFCGALYRNRLTGSLDHVDISVVLFDPNLHSPYGPAIVPIGFLDDKTEPALVRESVERLDRCRELVRQGEQYLAGRESGLASRTFDQAMDQLARILSGLFWRDFDAPSGQVVSGPYQALLLQIESARKQMTAETCRVLVDMVQRLVAEVHEGPAPVPMQPVPALPTWYETDQATSYDRYRYMHDSVGPLVAGLLNLTAAQRVMEVGAGTGRFSLAVLQAGACQDFVLMDRSAAMLDELYRKLPVDLANRVEVEVGGMEYLGHTRQRCDAILESEVFYQHPNFQRLARSIEKAISPTGLLIRLDPSTLVEGDAGFACQAFDLAIAAETGSPIGFVGENCMGLLDEALRGCAVETIWIELEPRRRIVPRDFLLQARLARTFPYLAHVPPQVLNRATSFLRFPKDSVTSLKECFRIGISARREFISSSSFARIVNYLKGTGYDIMSS